MEEGSSASKLEAELNRERAGRLRDSYDGPISFLSSVFEKFRTPELESYQLNRLILGRGGIGEVAARIAEVTKRVKSYTPTDNEDTLAYIQNLASFLIEEQHYFLAHTPDSAVEEAASILRDYAKRCKEQLPTHPDEDTPSLIGYIQLLEPADYKPADDPQMKIFKDEHAQPLVNRVRDTLLTDNLDWTARVNQIAKYIEETVPNPPWGSNPELYFIWGVQAILDRDVKIGHLNGLVAKGEFDHSSLNKLSEAIETYHTKHKKITADHPFF
ncbi:MAG: hypothetical protein KJ709_08905 [Nanoarchaeota archaeon]|nr:hypothetical protein [Nanoarchaeota archaeon]